MFKSFTSLFKVNKPSYIYSKEFKSGYKKLWIDNIRDYTP